MRKFTTHIYTKANYLLNRGRMALSNQRGDFYISDAVKIIIAVVLGEGWRADHRGPGRQRVHGVVGSLGDDHRHQP